MVALDPEQLSEPVVALVVLAIEPPRPDFEGRMVRPLQQVTLRPDKVLRVGEAAFIRLGETLGDEARCWIRCEHVGVVALLGMVMCEGDPADERARWVQVPAEARAA